jgi:transposase-like protein
LAQRAMAIGQQVARRYAMNANLIFKWLRDPR